MCLGLGHVGIATIEWLGLSAVAAALELREDQWEVEACVVAGCGGDARNAMLSYLACAPGARKKVYGRHLECKVKCPQRYQCLEVVRHIWDW